MSISIQHLPARAVVAGERLRDTLADVMGDDLVAVWVHGGTTFADRPRRTGDLDVCAVVANVADDERDPRIWRDDPAARPHRVYVAQAAIGTETGLTFDAMYLRADDVGRSEPPGEAFVRERRHPLWAVCRAHWLAGQYVHLYGASAEDLVVAPTAAELRGALDRELEHLERHVYEGDAADPYEATYAVWNGCRILYTLETGSPVISKRSAGAWALERLPDTWHAPIAAAGRAYDGEATDDDHELLRQAMPPFVAMVRERLPVTEPRPPGPPRWSV